MADTIANMWDETDYWQNRFGDVSVWNDQISPSDVNAEFMQYELEKYLGSDEYLVSRTQRLEQLAENRIDKGSLAPVDAIAVGGNYNLDIPILGPLGGAGTVGVELLADKNGQLVLYTYAGGGGSVGAGANVSVYVVRIRNLSAIEDYKGLSISTDATLSIGPAGFTAGWSESAVSGPYGEKFGFAPGANASLSGTAVEYSNPLFVR